MCKEMMMVMLNGGQCRQIPNVLIPPWQFKVSLRQGGRLLQKLGGVHPCGCGAALHGKNGHHITRAENRGKFFQQKFDISRHRIRNGLNRNG
jgi:hypothetical protein